MSIYSVLFNTYALVARFEDLDNIGGAVGVYRNKLNEPDSEFRTRMLCVVSPLEKRALDFVAEAAAQGIRREERTSAYIGFLATQSDWYSRIRLALFVSGGVRP